MDYTLPENIRLMRDTVQQFVKNDLEPISQKVEEEEKIPENIVQKMRDMGFFGLSIPEEYGGMGLGTLGECVLNEEFGKVNACFRSRFGTNNGIGSQGILIDGTPEQKEKYLPRIASGEWTAAFALTEPNAGSDAANIQTKAEKKGDVYLLNGLKHFITNGDIADVSTVMAVTDKTKGPRGVTAFIVEKTFPGYSVGKIDKKMGVHGNNTSELVFEDCQVPAGNIIGLQEGKGFSTAMKVLEKGRITIAAFVRGDRPGLSGHEHRPLQAAGPVRQADLRQPGHPVDAGGHGDLHLHREADRVPHGLVPGPETEGHPAGGDVQSVLHRDGEPGGGFGPPDPRRNGVHEGVAHRAHLPGYAAVSGSSREPPKCSGW